MTQQNNPFPWPRRYACTYEPDCDREATTTVVINGQARAVCEECRRVELAEQNTERASQQEFAANDYEVPA